MPHAVVDERPLVSVVVPVFNGARYLRQCLDSILAQTYPRIDVLVMDDASTDETPAIIESYGDRVRSVRQPQNKGQFGNVGDGIDLARGEFVAIYHADDIYDSRIVEREAEFLHQHSEVGAVFCYDIFINAAGREYGRLTTPPEFRSRSVLSYADVLNGILTYKNVFLPTPGAMVRASMYRELGKFRGAEFRIASDLEMWLRIARRYRIGVLHEYLFSYRHGHENSSQVYYRLRTEPERHFVILDEYLDAGGRALATPAALVAHEAHRAEDYLMIAVNEYIRGERRESRTTLARVSARRLVASPRVQRGRLLVLYCAMHALLRLPRLSFVADLFYRRWHVKTYPA